MQAYIATVDNICYLSFCGSNFNVGYCSEYKSSEETEISLRDLYPILKKCNAVVLQGGEPTLQRQACIDIAMYCKKNNISTHLITNGSKPFAIHSLLNLVDIITLELYSPLVEKQFESITKSHTFFVTTQSIIDDIKKTIELLQNSNISVTVRTYVVPTRMYKKEDLILIAQEIQNLDCVFDIKPFSNHNPRDKKYHDINKPTVEFLNTLKQEILKTYPHMRITIE